MLGISAVTIHGECRPIGFSRWVGWLLLPDHNRQVSCGDLFDLDEQLALKNTQFGISAAVATPFDQFGGIDHERLLRHVKILLAEGCNSLTLFGTTGEGTAIDLKERRAIISNLLKEDIAAHCIVIGVAACSIGDAVEQALLGAKVDCRALLVAPPFYSKNISDDGLFNWYGKLFDTIGPCCPPVILYHIPQVTGVSLTFSLVRRLKAAYPSLIYGVKDSSGDWSHTSALLQLPDVAVLIGDERHLAEATRLGAKGTISGLANVLVDELSQIYSQGNENTCISRLVDSIVKFPVTAAIKVLIAAKYDDPAWLGLRFPLESLSADDADHLRRIYRNMYPQDQDRKRAG